MLALVLDRSHAVLLDGDHVIDVAASTARPLVDVQTSLALRGVTVRSPAGSRAHADGAGRDFVFIVERFAAPAGMTWRPLRELAASDAIWELYGVLVLGGWQPPTRELDVWAFGNEPEMAAKLVHLVTCGTKRVTMGWVEAAERDGSPLAYEGGVSVVTDGYGYPRCVLRSVEVRVVPFAEVDEASAAGEGEGDLTHADWREAHVAYFSGEAAQLGLVFDDRARISVERFEVLHVVGRRDG